MSHEITREQRNRELLANAVDLTAENVTGGARNKKRKMPAASQYSKRAECQFDLDVAEGKVEWMMKFEFVPPRVLKKAIDDVEQAKAALEACGSTSSDA